MNYAEIKYYDIANGVGVRTSLFVAGCRHHCPFCFNEDAWSFETGSRFTSDVASALIESLEPSYIAGLSVLGGEPLEPENQEVLAPFLEQVKKIHPHKSIWLYTGFTWEELVDGPSRAQSLHIERILNTLDIVVDGPFIQAKKDISLRFRGSANQRIIDVAASLASGKPYIWEDDPVFATHAIDAVH